MYGGNSTYGQKPSIAPQSSYGGPMWSTGQSTIQRLRADAASRHPQTPSNPASPYVPPAETQPKPGYPAQGSAPPSPMMQTNAAMPQVPAAGFTQAPSQPLYGAQQTNAMSPAMMQGPQSPAPIAPYNPSAGAIQQAPGAVTPTADHGNWLGATVNGVTPGGYAKQHAAEAGFAQQQAGWGTNTGGFQQQLQGQLNAGRAAEQPQLDANNAAAAASTTAQMAARGIGANGQPQFGGEAFTQNWMPQDAQMRQQMQPQVQQMAAMRAGQGMTPLQQATRQRGVGGDFVGQWQPPQTYGGSSPLMRSLYGA